MRRLLAFSLTLLVAACATAPRPTEPTPPLPPQSEHIGGGILGLTADEVVRRFGTPALQIREALVVIDPQVAVHGGPEIVWGQRALGSVRATAEGFDGSYARAGWCRARVPGYCHDTCARS